MEIREASERDIPNIISVLKASLGESSSQKTEAVWRYKHVNNPFGKSLVLIAVEGDAVIGVRAFMRWKWQLGTKEYTAFRAVDTATHPDHQGKGIFKKLTLKALEIGKQQEANFVFNTPNSQSKPGYLKMGWKEVGKVGTVLRPVNPLYWRNKEALETSIEKSREGSAVLQLEKKHLELINSGKLFTPKSDKFLEWRYMNNPIQRYEVFSTDFYFLSAYVKEHKKVRELRVSELILFDEKAKILVRKLISSLGRRTGVHFVSLAPHAEIYFPFSFSGHFGPTLTFREINVEEEQKEMFLKINTWYYSLGDFELF